MKERPCVFCELLAGRLPGTAVVLSAPDVLAFLDHRPLFPGHVLVVPRRHVDTVASLPDELVEPYFRAVRSLAAALPLALGCEGTFVAANNVVSQSVAHLHFHVVPRTKGDGLRGFFWPRQRYGSDEEMAAVATRIHAALATCSEAR